METAKLAKWNALQRGDRDYARRVASLSIWLTLLCMLFFVMIAVIIILVLAAGAIWTCRTTHEEFVCHNVTNITLDCGYVFCRSSAEASLLGTEKKITLSQWHVWKSEYRRWARWINATAFACFVLNSDAVAREQLLQESSLLSIALVLVIALVPLVERADATMDTVTDLRRARPDLEEFYDEFPLDLVENYTRPSRKRLKAH